jgi:aspartate 1-decarboxylase
MSDYTLLKSKLHRATVTGASLHYEGSLTVAEDLAKQAGFLPYEKILVGNINNGERLTIMSFAQVPAELAAKHHPTIVRLDEKNDVML